MTNVISLSIVPYGGPLSRNLSWGPYTSSLQVCSPCFLGSLMAFARETMKDKQNWGEAMSFSEDFGRSVLLGVWNVPFPLREGDRCVPVQIGHWKWVVVSVNCQCTKAHDWHWGKGWGRRGKAFWNLCEEYKGRGSACANCRGNLLHIYMHILYRIKTLQYSLLVAEFVLMLKSHRVALASVSTQPTGLPLFYCANLPE